MFYRQKALLGLIESFGGVLQRTDCQKLMFMFCRYASKIHYDFYPHKYGAYSAVITQDKVTLTQKEFLKDSADFELVNGQSFVEQLIPKDQAVLNNELIPMYGDLRGKALLKQLYLNYPAYTYRSEILADVLSPSELAYVRNSWNTDRSIGIFTLGYEGLTIDAFLNKLISNNVELLVDVRNNPHSMKYDFRKRRFRSHIESVGIKYYHIPELGIPSTKRQNLKCETAYKELLSEYENNILINQREPVQRLLNWFSQFKRVTLTCFESDYRLCHRYKLADYLSCLSNYEIPVTHL